MTEELTPGQRLYESYRKVADAQQLVEATRQALNNAQGDYFDKNSRFLGQVEFVAGGPCSWKADDEKKEVTVELLPEAPKSESEPATVETGAAADGSAGADAETDADNVVALPSQSG